MFAIKQLELRAGWPECRAGPAEAGPTGKHARSRQRPL